MGTVAALDQGASRLVVPWEVEHLVEQRTSPGSLRQELRRRDGRFETDRRSLTPARSPRAWTTVEPGSGCSDEGPMVSRSHISRFADSEGGACWPRPRPPRRSRRPTWGPPTTIDFHTFLTEVLPPRLLRGSGRTRPARHRRPGASSVGSSAQRVPGASVVVGLLTRGRARRLVLAPHGGAGRTDDMSFLVDSVTADLVRSGHAIHLGGAPGRSRAA